MEAAWIALVATLFGGAGLKTIEGFLARGQKKDDAAKQIREELRQEGQTLKQEAVTLREEIRQVEKELDNWKERYFVLLQEHLEIKAKCADHIGRVAPEEVKEW